MRGLVIVILALFALSLVALRAHAQDNTVHPIMGLARACVTAAGQPPACEVLRAPGDYATVEECNADMLNRLRDLGRRIQHDHPDWGFNAQVACVPDREAFEASAT